MLSAVELELVFVTKVELALYVFCCGASVRLCFINPRPEGYGSRFAFCRSFVLFIALQSTESSAHLFAPVKVRTSMACNLTRGFC